MPVAAETTPNPNAMKYTVGRPVGGPSTFTAGQSTDDPLGAELVAIAGVSSVFMTADFVTLSKEPEADWDDISPRALAVLEAHFG
jgi:hypothetical protein